MTFRAGLAAVNAGAPAARRAEVASSYFIVLYVGLAIPVIGEGLLARDVGLRTAGLVFAGVVAGLSAAVLVLLRRHDRSVVRSGDRRRRLLALGPRS
jgi:hypothetical protein